MPTDRILANQRPHYRRRPYLGWIDWDLVAACGPSLTLGLWCGYLFYEVCGGLGALVWEVIKP
jgi:hypothetical protein